MGLQMEEFGKKDLGPRFLVKFQRSGEGNRGQMPHVGPGSPLPRA